MPNPKAKPTIQESGSYVPQPLQNGGIDGIFIHGPEPDREVQKILRKFPVVWLLQQGYKDFGDRVQPDHAHAGKQACLHLIDQG